MPAVYAYDPKKVTVIAGGEVITDFAQSTFIQVQMNNQQFSFTEGLTTGVRTYNPNKSGSITITLLQGSPSNAIFDLFLRADISDEGGVGHFPLLINDNNAIGQNLSWLCKATTCWVQGFPQWTLGNTVAQRTWTLQTNVLDYRPIVEYSNLENETGAQRARDEAERAGVLASGQ